MSQQALDIAVVGHTNVGKTSLMRTLTREREFGEVSSRPATTRHVEMAEIAVEGGGRLRLYDTPGLEDSSGLLAHLEERRAAHGGDWTDAIDALIGEGAESDFAQEAKALRQVRASDVALYVIDAREAVRARHRDELEILGRCAIPVLPVLNFVAETSARQDEWREQLARVNMHAVVGFDTVVFDEAHELALYGKIASLADRFAPVLQRLSDALTARRRQLRRASAALIADLLVDTAAARRSYPVDDEAAKAAAEQALKETVRRREAQCVDALLEMHRFSGSDYRLEDLPIRHGAWTEDLFDPDVLQRYGLSAGRAAATGAAAGVAVDLMVGGITLGAAAATGAVVGFLVDTARLHGGRILDRLSGIAALRADEPTLLLLAERETALLRALLRRGHAAQGPIEVGEARPGVGKRLLPYLKQAKAEPAWSRLNEAAGIAGARRQELVDDIARIVENAL